jgi:hypothetical protein
MINLSSLVAHSNCISSLSEVAHVLQTLPSITHVELYNNKCACDNQITSAYVLTILNSTPNRKMKQIDNRLIIAEDYIRLENLMAEVESELVISKLAEKGEKRIKELESIYERVLIKQKVEHNLITNAISESKTRNKNDIREGDIFLKQKFHEIRIDRPIVHNDVVNVEQQLLEYIDSNNNQV